VFNENKEKIEFSRIPIFNAAISDEHIALQTRNHL